MLCISISANVNEVSTTADEVSASVDWLINISFIYLSINLHILHLLLFAL